MLGFFSYIILVFFLIQAGNAWTTGSSDFEQFLIIDLGRPRNLTRIATRGRSHSDEYVKEYVISFGFNGLDYSDYKETDGSRKVSIIFLFRCSSPLSLLWFSLKKTNKAYCGTNKEISRWSVFRMLLWVSLCDTIIIIIIPMKMKTKNNNFVHSEREPEKEEWVLGVFHCQLPSESANQI